MDSHFRTTRHSDARFENDHLRFYTVKSKNLKGRGDICLFVPPDEIVKEPLPIVILLHGVYGSAWSWALSAGAHKTALCMMQAKSIRSMILAMPSDGLWGDGSAYLPHSGYDFEKWICEDVIALVREAVCEERLSSDICLAGLSMGGYGALRIGAKYGETFLAISAHSSITSLTQMPLFVEEAIEDYGVNLSKDNSVIETILYHKDQLPAIRFDCGKEDLLIKFNRRLHQELTAASIEHEYQEFSGSHQWAYWEEHLKDSLLFFEKIISSRTK